MITNLTSLVRRFKDRRYARWENDPFQSVTRTSHWTRQNASEIQQTPQNVFPTFDIGRVKALMPDYHIWDSWFVLDEQGKQARIGGKYTMLVALGTPKGGDGSARIFYFYAQDGHTFTPGGTLLSQKLYGDTQEWSGSTILRNDGSLQTFYTLALGVTDPDTGIWQTSQRFATVIQSPFTGPTVLSVSEPHYHGMLGEPDGQLYQNVAQSLEIEHRAPTQHNRAWGSDQTDNLCFRDPSFFRDPNTGKAYLVFEGNTGTRFHPAGSVRRDYIGSADFEPSYMPTADDLKANGCVGIAEFTNDNLTFINFLPPILTTNLVTDEIERITMISRAGYYYLFCVTHGNKMTMGNDDLINRDFLLGFRAKSLFGPFEPLNDSGVVIQQKSAGLAYAGQEENEHYVYSWTVLSDLSVISYANYCADDNGSTVATKTIGPRVKLQINGLRTRIVDLDYPYQPAS